MPADLQQFLPYALPLGLFILVFIMSSRGKKKMAAQREERDRMLKNDMVPGVWVKTAVGFWGRYVDQDGDIIILETPDGTETCWERSIIREVGEPPFAKDVVESTSFDTDEKVNEDEEEQILGLHSSDSDSTKKLEENEASSYGEDTQASEDTNKH